MASNIFKKKSSSKKIFTDRVIILAAGKSKRMQSNIPKTLQPIGQFPILWHILQTILQNKKIDVSVVVSNLEHPVAKYVSQNFSNKKINIDIHEQKKQLGTAHAVKTCWDNLKDKPKNTLITLGDVPFLKPQTIENVFQKLHANADVVLVGFKTKQPKNYGRIILNDDNFPIKIVEEKDATPEQKNIQFCNSGIIGVTKHIINDLLPKIKASETTGEYYLTDLVNLASKKDFKIECIYIDQEEALGINDKYDLHKAEDNFQKIMRDKFREKGVVMPAPDTIYFAADTKIGTDSIIQPFVVFGSRCIIGRNNNIKSFSYLEDTQIADHCSVGPYARLRPGSILEDDSRVGNFCEIKNSTIGSQSKINHLSYVGDAMIGSNVNLGAGTITCNYDGYKKHSIQIEQEAFIGSNCSLVAPIKIGAGAYIASGSTITNKVPKDSLAFARSLQTNKDGRAKKLRARLSSQENE